MNNNNQALVSISQIYKIIYQQKVSLHLKEYSEHQLQYSEVLNLLDDVLNSCELVACQPTEIIEQKCDQIVEQMSSQVTEQLPKRKCQSKNERTVENAIKQLGYTPYHNVIKRDCIGKQRPLPFDFGILVNGKELLIEFDGEHHRAPIDHFGGKEKAKEVALYDRIKDDYCKEHNIPLLRLSRRSSVLKELTKFIETYS